MCDRILFVMPDSILLLPILLPLVLAPVFAWIARRAEHTRHALTILFFILEISAILVNIAPGSHRLVISTWQAAAFSIALQMDGIAILLALTTSILLLTLWLAAPPAPISHGRGRDPFDFPTVLVFSAALLLIAAEGLLAICFALTLLDLSLFVWRLAHNIERETAARSLVVGLFAGLILVAGALLIGTARAAEHNGALLIALAFWARLGLFPFHSLLPTHGVDTSDLWYARAMPMLAASALWMRWQQTLTIAAPGDVIAWLALATFIITLVWIWREEEPSRAVGVSTMHGFALVPLAVAFGGDAAPVFALWLALSAVFAFAFFETALRWRAENRNRWTRLLWFGGVIALAGPPLTPAFLGRVGVYVSLAENGQWLTLLLAALATLLLLAPLWNFAFALAGAEMRDPKRGESAALIIITLWFAALTFAPMLIANVLGAKVGEAADAAMLRVIWTNDLLGVLLGFVLLFVPLVASYWLRGSVRGLHLRPGSPWMRVARWLDLTWLEHGVVSMGYRAGMTARNISTMAEENPTVWLLLVGLWVAILILAAR